MQRLCWDKVDSFFSLSRRVDVVGNQTSNWPKTIHTVMGCLWNKARLNKWFGKNQLIDLPTLVFSSVIFNSFIQFH